MDNTDQLDVLAPQFDGSVNPNLSTSGPTFIEYQGSYTWSALDANYHLHASCQIWSERQSGGSWQPIGAPVKTMQGSVTKSITNANEPDFDIRVEAVAWHSAEGCSTIVLDSYIWNVAVERPLDPAMSVSVDGPTCIPSTSPSTWYAVVSGGDGSYTYNWHIQFTPGGSTDGTSSSFTVVPAQLGASSSSYTLNLTVSDGEQQKSVTRTGWSGAC